MPCMQAHGLVVVEVMSIVLVRQVVWAALQPHACLCEQGASAGLHLKGIL